MTTLNTLKIDYALLELNYLVDMFVEQSKVKTLDDFGEYEILDYANKNYDILDYLDDDFIVDYVADNCDEDILDKIGIDDIRTYLRRNYDVSDVVDWYY